MMTDKELWAEFTRIHPEASGKKYEAWCYGSEAADELARLTWSGMKTATASAYPLYEIENEPLPEEGEYNIILYSDGTAACVTKTVKVYTVAYRDVTAHHAFREGEGDRSLAYWRRIHEAFFREEMKEAGLMFTEDMPVVCGEFEVVFKSAAAEFECP